MKMSKNSEIKNDRQPLLKRILLVIFLIIVCFLLITSCASGFWGKIGDLYESISKYFIKEETDNKKVYNEELKFLTSSGFVTLDDIYKVSFITSKINPKTYTCQTSDANIATCAVKNDYVEVYPKKEGSVIVYVYATSNGKDYIGTHKLTITKNEIDFYIPSFNGVIDLNYSNTLRIPYVLNNLNATINVSSSNSDIIVAKLENGVIMITGNKPGKANITISTSINGVKKDYTYEIVVKEDKENLSSECYLESLSLDGGKLSPKFNKDITSYETVVNTSNITITSKYKGSNVYYYVNNTKVNDLKNISLNEGINIIVINVISEDGTSKKYTIKVNNKSTIETPSLSDINTLDELSISGYELEFDSNKNDYTLLVNYNTNNIKLNLKSTDSKSNVTYKINDNTITDINNIIINSGNNLLSIIVRSESGLENTYNINVKRAIRKVEIDKTLSKINIENGTTDIIYYILEDKEINGIFNRIDDYNVSDITLIKSSIDGTISLNKGVISITPNSTDLNKNVNLTLKYGNSSSSISLLIDVNEYYIKLIQNNYNYDYSSENNEKSMIFNTNLFNNNISYEQIDGGIKLYNDIGYITITSSNKDVLEVLYKETDNSTISSYITFRTKLKDRGNVSINITLNVLGHNVESKNINVNVSRKYLVVIDSADGFYDSFTTRYEFLLDYNSTINLSDYVAYKVDTTGNCLYYTIDSYNTSKNNDGTRYNKDQVITIVDDITLYAIYTSDSKYITITESNIKYLTDVDLFFNEEYYQEHNVKKIIYPNAHGSHTTYITNNTANKIDITKFNLEEDTICVSNGCINMGYIIKYTKQTEDSWTYIYGNKDSYSILNLDSNAIKNVNNNSISIPSGSILLEPGEEVVISILWKWVDINDSLDTAIGNITSDNNYSLTVSIEYDKTNKYCED